MAYAGGLDWDEWLDTSAAPQRYNGYILSAMGYTLRPLELTVRMTGQAAHSLFTFDGMNLTTKLLFLGRLAFWMLVFTKTRVVPALTSSQSAIAVLLFSFLLSLIMIFNVILLS